MATLFQTITRSVKHWYIPLMIGIILIAAGIYAFMVPLETYLTLSVLFSISFIVIGLLDIFFSIRNQQTPIRNYILIASPYASAAASITASASVG